MPALATRFARCSPRAPDVPVETLRTVADRFDRAQIAQDRAAWRR